MNRALACQLARWSAIAGNGSRRIFYVSIGTLEHPRSEALSPMALFQHPIFRRRQLFWLLVLATLALGAGLGLRDPSPPDEPRFALAAKHIVETGDWLLPRRGREYYAEKPPVFMWLQAASYTIARDWRIAFLLPSLLAAMATLWLTADMAGRIWGRRHAPHAAAALFVCLQFGLQAKRGQIDMVLVALTTLALWGLLRHLLTGPDWRAAWIGAFAAGVGTVTKGVGFLPLLVLIPWLFVRRDLLRSAPPASDEAAVAWRWLVFVLAFAAGTAVWLGPLLLTMARDSDPALRAYARDLLFHQTGERYARAWHHVQPAWYYLQSMATMWLPGALLLPWLLPAWWRRLRRRDPRYVLLLGWSVLVLLFFSCSPGKREVYIFPALPALCIASAPMLPALLRLLGVQRMLFAYLIISACALTLVGAYGLSSPGDWLQNMADRRGISGSTIPTICAWLLAVGAFGLVLAASARLSRIAIAVAMFTAALWTAFGLGLAPALDASSSARELMLSVGKQIGPDAELGLIAWREQHLLQADRPAIDFGFKQPRNAQWNEATAWATQAPARRWLFVIDEALSPCVDTARTVVAGQSNRRTWLLVPGTALDPGCITPSFDAAVPEE